MEAVFGLLEDERTFIVKQFTGDFITAVRGQTVHNPAIMSIKQLCIQLIGHHLLQTPVPLLGETRVGEKLHVYPRVGVDNIAFGDGFPQMTGGFAWYLPRLRGRYLVRQSVVGALLFCCCP